MYEDNDFPLTTLKGNSKASNSKAVKKQPVSCYSQKHIRKFIHKFK